jgi:hypothetical protein
MSTDDLLIIHCRFPVLAFILALCNPSTISGTLTSTPTDVRPLQTRRSPTLRNLLAHSLHLPFRISTRLSLWVHDLILHIVAAECYAMIAYQVLMIGWKSVVVFACWTWHNPFMWVSTGGILHLMRVISWKLCLGAVNESQHGSRWTLSISRDGENLRITRPSLARMWALFFKVAGVMNYGYRTVVLSGMMLVNPYMALRTFVLVGLSGLIAKLVTLWLLTLYPDVEIEGTEPLTMSESEAFELLVRKPDGDTGSLQNNSTTRKSR